MAQVEVQQTPDIHDLVVRASLNSYEEVGQRGVPFWETEEESGRRPDIVLPGLRRTEEVETEESFDSLDSGTIELRRRPGMELWVVIPASRLAAAHERLRGVADRIQPWSLEGGQLTFGRPRVP